MLGNPLRGRARYAWSYVAIFNPCLCTFDLNLLSFKFELHVQNLFKFKTNSSLNLTFDLNPFKI